jgi:glycosyltransferase involved in cell wall biosynthesis
LCDYDDDSDRRKLMSARNYEQVVKPEDAATPFVSVVVPVYGDTSSLEELCHRLLSVFDDNHQTREILLVDDGGPDENWSVISGLANDHLSIVGIQLSRNFGQHRAIEAGLSFSRGSWVVVMDCDLQDRPEEISRLFEESQRGFDQVVALRTDRQDTAFRRLTSTTYCKALSVVLGSSVTPGIGNFGLYHRNVINAIMSLSEQDQSFGLSAILVGFRRSEIPVQHDARRHGSSTYSFRKLFHLALMSVLTYSDRPLRIILKIGILLTLFVSGAGLWVAITSYSRNSAPPGWLTLVFLNAFCFGALMSTLGIVALYLGRIFLEVKRRPKYFVRATTAQSSR